MIKQKESAFSTRLKHGWELAEWERAIYHDPEVRFTLYTQERTLLLSQHHRDKQATCAWNWTPSPQDSSRHIPQQSYKHDDIRQVQPD